jgi:hypothetical protein
MAVGLEPAGAAPSFQFEFVDVELYCMEDEVFVDESGDDEEVDVQCRRISGALKCEFSLDGSTWCRSVSGATLPIFTRPLC